MRRTLIAVAWITAFGMPGLGCKSHDQLVIDTICPAICRCESFDPVGDCERFCRLELQPEEISPECFDCFLEEEESACELLLDRCERVCELDEPPPPPPFFDAPRGIP